MPKTPLRAFAMAAALLGPFAAHAGMLVPVPQVPDSLETDVYSINTANCFDRQLHGPERAASTASWARSTGSTSFSTTAKTPTPKDATLTILAWSPAPHSNVSRPGISFSSSVARMATWHRLR